MNASKQEKTLTLLKNLNLQVSKKKSWMPFKIFEFLEQFMIGAFLIILTQLEKTVSIGKIFIPLGNVKNKFHFRN